MAGKILVAEDDPEARELLKLLLGGADYHLLEAADGVEALELLRAEQPDLLITDIVMPRMDGYELVRRLRQEKSHGGHAGHFLLRVLSRARSARDGALTRRAEHAVEAFRSQDGAHDRSRRARLAQRLACARDHRARLQTAAHRSA